MWFIKSNYYKDLKQLLGNTDINQLVTQLEFFCKEGKGESFFAYYTSQSEGSSSKSELIEKNIQKYASDPGYITVCFELDKNVLPGKTPSFAVEPYNKESDTGYVCMPLVKNVPAGKEGWLKTTCPICGRECWNRPGFDEELNNMTKKACTECALQAHVNCHRR